MTREMETAAYENGNDAFRSGNFEQALACYERGYDSADDIMLEKLLLNSAQCNLMLRNYDAVVAQCSRVIVMNSTGKAKALLRRAVAWEAMEEFPKSLKDLNSARKLESAQQYEGEIVKILFRVSRAAQLDLAVLQQDSRPPTFLSKHQTLRLNFGEMLPTTLTYGKDYFIRLNITNEFGLWNRELLSLPAAAATISCIVYRAWGGVSPRLTFDAPDGIGVDGRIVTRISLSTDEHAGVSGCALVMLKFFTTSPLCNGQTVLPILTLPLVMRWASAQDSTDSQDIASGAAQMALQLQCAAGRVEATAIRSHAMPVCALDDTDNEVYVLESPGSLGIGGKVWDATFSLLDFLAANPDTVRNRAVIELGSGTGLAGLSLRALSPTRVVLTDMEEITPLLTANILLNEVMAVGADNSATVDFIAVPQLWGTPLHSHITDSCAATARDGLSQAIVIASDVVYDPLGYAPLVDTIRNLLLTQSGVDGHSLAECVILSQRHRNPEDHKFFDMIRDLTSNLQIVDITPNRASVTENTRGDETLQDIKLFKITKNWCPSNC